MDGGPLNLQRRKDSRGFYDLQTIRKITMGVQVWNPYELSTYDLVRLGSGKPFLSSLKRLYLLLSRFHLFGRVPSATQTERLRRMSLTQPGLPLRVLLVQLVQRGPIPSPSRSKPATVMWDSPSFHWGNSGRDLLEFFHSLETASKRGWPLNANSVDESLEGHRWNRRRKPRTRRRFGRRSDDSPQFRN